MTDNEKGRKQFELIENTLNDLHRKWMNENDFMWKQYFREESLKIGAALTVSGIVGGIVGGRRTAIICALIGGTSRFLLSWALQRRLIST